MSEVLGYTSKPASLLVSALPYQCPATGAPGKSRQTDVVPALPRTADVAVQFNAVHCASIRIGTRLASVLPHWFAAAWNAINRCSPKVEPEFPPTGVAGVVSLNPTPARSLLTTVTLAACPATESIRPSADKARSRQLLLDIMRLASVSSSVTAGTARNSIDGLRGSRQAVHLRRPILGLREHHVAVRRFVEHQTYANPD